MLVFIGEKDVDTVDKKNKIHLFSLKGPGKIDHNDRTGTNKYIH